VQLRRVHHRFSIWRASLPFQCTTHSKPDRSGQGENAGGMKKVVTTSQPTSVMLVKRHLVYYDASQAIGRAT
jgi:hypothetical protein